MRTLEFGLYPTRAQEQQLLAWLELHRRIWNYGLALLIELERFTAYDKASKERVPCCPVPWSYRWQKAPDETWQAVPYSEVRRFRDGGGLSCPIPEDHRSPRLSGDSYFTMAAFFAKKNHPNWVELKTCSKNLIRGTVQALNVAWSEYKTHKRDAMGRTRKIPRFKGARFPITTLNDTDCK